MGEVRRSTRYVPDGQESVWVWPSVVYAVSLLRRFGASLDARLAAAAPVGEGLLNVRDGPRRRAVSVGIDSGGSRPVLAHRIAGRSPVGTARPDVAAAPVVPLDV